MAVLEQQNNAISKFDKFESHDQIGKKPQAADPFADVRDGGKFQALKEEKEKALAILKEKKLLPDADIIMDDGPKGGTKDDVKGGGGKVKGGKDGWIDCIKPAPEALQDGLTFDPNKKPVKDGGVKDPAGATESTESAPIKKPMKDGGIKTEFENQHGDTAHTQKDESRHNAIESATEVQI
jgi:hypothetical protein